MRTRLLLPVFPFLALVCIATFLDVSVAQAPNSGEALGDEVALAKLYPPVYPPIDRAARFTGDVTIQVRVRRDGSISSAEVASGHPLLNGSALESAQKSTFICRSCKEQVTSYSLTYTFSLREDVDCVIKRPRLARCLYLWRCGWWRRRTPPRVTEVTQSPNHIKILADAECITPSDGSH
jgi:TonB family protein